MTLPQGRQAARGMTADEIAAWLRDGIYQGRWAAGEAIPTNADLCRETGATNTTVSKAVTTLKAEGLLIGRKGGRPRVADLRAIDYRVTDQTRPDWYTAPQRADMFATTAAGRRPHKEMIVKWVKPDPGVAQRLGIDSSEDVAMRRVVQSTDGHVIAVETAYYPRWIAEELGLDDPGDIAEGVTRRVGATQHRHSGWLTETIVRPATAQEQAMFSVAPGTVLLEVTTISANAANASCVSTRVVHPTGVRIVHEVGDDGGLRTIRTNREAL